MILVTGATGLLGSHLLYELISNGESCVALCHSKSKISQVTDLFNYYNPSKADEFLNRIIWKEGDLLDIFFLKNYLLTSLTFIIVRQKFLFSNQIFQNVCAKIGK
jgi:nucleoside-diphosphate-sugar epimerase